MLLFAPLIIFPALGVVFLFASIFSIQLGVTQSELWKAYKMISFFGVVMAYMGNTVIGIPVIFILDKLKRLNYLNVVIFLLFLVLAFCIKEGPLYSFNVLSLDSLKFLLWKFLCAFYFSICVATTDYLIFKK
ncbi:hypothetical protein C7Y70_02435 [Pseudoalteromonas sp. KS88]|nr:hypothetical protein C7Y70_02435 [Pseudoalteromonas sp. KS88]